jgi:hypothetical protein
MGREGEGVNGIAVNLRFEDEGETAYKDFPSF